MFTLLLNMISLFKEVKHITQKSVEDWGSVVSITLVKLVVSGANAIIQFYKVFWQAPFEKETSLQLETEQEDGSLNVISESYFQLY
jgi:hypothetical protein